MPSGYHIDVDAGLILLSGTDEVDITQAIAVGRAVLADPAFDTRLAQLVDLRGLKLLRDAATSAQFRDFALREYAVCLQTSMAVVVDDSLDQRSLASLYHLTSRMPRTELFDDYDTAMRWLMRREFASGASTDDVYPEAQTGNGCPE